MPCEMQRVEAIQPTEQPWKNVTATNPFPHNDTWLLCKPSHPHLPPPVTATAPYKV